MKFWGLLFEERGIFFILLLANVDSNTACFMCWVALLCTIPSAFHISLCNLQDQCILLFGEKKKKLSESNVIISRFVYVSTKFFFVYFDLSQCATKCMTGKSRCEMRGCIYNSTQIYRKWIDVFENVDDPVLSMGPNSSWARLLSRQAYYEKDSCQNRLGCRNLRRHSQFQTWWTHIFFFRSCHFFSSRRACLVLR